MIVYSKILENKVKLLTLQTKLGKNESISWDEACEFLSIVQGEQRLSVESNIVEMCESLGANTSMWPALVTGSKRNEITAKMKQELVSAFQETEKYFLVWLKVRRFLDSIGLVRLEPSIFGEACQSHKKIVADVAASPVQQVIYKTSKSSTGRLTIVSGPNFLVLPRASRNALCAFEKGSSIYSIDFTSLEPRVALWASSTQSNEEDVYATLMQMCDISERSIAKQATLSSLYGAGVSRLSRTLGGVQKAKSLVERVSRFFEVPDLEARLNQQAQNGMICNAFGRPLHEAKKQPRLRVNHYVQSSSAELANLLFSDLCQKNPKVTPLLVIHDALIVEVPEHAKNKFFSDAKSIYHEGVWFPTKTELINN